MKTKIALLAMAAVACILLNSSIDIVKPSIDASIAVDQLQDSETAAITMRSYDRFASSIPLISWTMTGLFGLVLFYGRLVTLAKSAWENL